MTRRNLLIRETLLHQVIHHINLHSVRISWNILPASNYSFPKVTFFPPMFTASKHHFVYVFGWFNKTFNQITIFHPTLCLNQNLNYSRIVPFYGNSPSASIVLFGSFAWKQLHKLMCLFCWQEKHPFQNSKCFIENTIIAIMTKWHSNTCSLVFSVVHIIKKD